MAVAIRLRREGAIHRPYYRIVVADSRTRRDGPFIEMIGTYDPMMKEEVNYKIDLPAAEAWIGKGAQPSETVASIVRKARLAQPKAKA
jgi:small subunit ribosomal protein S16